MPRPVPAIRNLGPRREALFARAGIRSAEEVEAMGTIAARRRLQEAGVATTLVGLYALHAALRGRDWRSLTPDEKAIREGDAARRACGQCRCAPRARR